jgi:hypothetical protein
MYAFTPPDGTIRWTGTDFEGYKLGSWVSLTGAGSSLWQESGSNAYRASGKVGIGTSSPVGQLHLSGGNGSQSGLKIEASEGDGASFYYSTNNGLVMDSYRSSDGRRLGMLLQPNGGRVSVGTLTPSAGFHVDFGGATTAVRADNSVSGGFSQATLVAENASAADGVAGYLVSNGTDATLALKNNGTGSLIKAYQTNTLVFEVSNGGDISHAGTISPMGGDMAELVRSEESNPEMEAGDVLVVSSTLDESVAKSQESYSTRVAGVFATRPGVLLRRKSSPNDETKVPLGLTGIIPTKVCGQNGPIQRGDLLVTSDTPGHAMRADPKRLSFGMVIGKAMEPFIGPGEGTISVLVNVR